MPLASSVACASGEAERRIDEHLQDLLGGGVGHLFDVHAALGRCHQRHALGGAVGDGGHVIFLLDVGAVFDQQAADLLAQRAGLVRDQLHAENFSGQLADFVHRAGQLDTTTLAAAARMDLRLDDPHRATELLRGFHRLLDSECSNAAGHRHTKFAQDLLALVFVNLHEVSLGMGNNPPDRRKQSSGDGRRTPKPSNVSCCNAPN